jgi:hypothetical protein
MDEPTSELLCDALAEFLYGLWQEQQHNVCTAASAATSADEPASASEANCSG